MKLQMTLIRRMVLFTAFALSTLAVVTTTADAQQTPSPALVVVVRGTGYQGLEIVDPNTNKVVKSVDLGVGGNPHLVATSTDGKFAYVTNPGGMNVGSDPKAPRGTYISVIDLEAQKEVRKIETGPGSYPHDIKFSGGKLYFTTEMYETIGCYDPASDKIEWVQGTAQIRSHQLVVSDDQTKIFTANSGSDSVSAITRWDPAVDTQTYLHNPPPNWAITAIHVGNGPEGIAMSPDGKEVWVANRGDGSVSIIDVSAKKVIQTLKLNDAKDPNRLQFTPNGKLVILTDEGSEGGQKSSTDKNREGSVLVFDVATRKEIKRFKLGTAQGFVFAPGIVIPHGVHISPDSTRAYVSVLAGKSVAVYDLNKLELITRIPVGNYPEGMAWVERK
jgi:YVTN family beta-propeller protein